MRRACGGLAGVVSDAVFGAGNSGGNQLPARKVEDIHQIRPGDIVILFDQNKKVTHLVAAASGVLQTERDDSGREICVVDCCEGNVHDLGFEGGFVGINSYYFPKEKSDDRFYEIWTRYPD